MWGCKEVATCREGINLATRSVLVFFLFWMIIIYVFALVLRQVTEGNSIGTTYFSTVPESATRQGTFPWVCQCEASGLEATLSPELFESFPKSTSRFSSWIRGRGIPSDSKSNKPRPQK